MWGRGEGGERGEKVPKKVSKKNDWEFVRDEPWISGG
jgi:hypothetical protein